MEQLIEIFRHFFFLLIPGVIVTLTIMKIKDGYKITNWEFVIYSCLYGLATFLIMEICYSLYNFFYCILSPNYSIIFKTNLSIWDYLFNNNNKINNYEILISYIVSIPIGFFFVYFASKKIFFKLFQKYKLTNQFGTNDVWSEFLSKDSTTWIVVRNENVGLTYYGHLTHWSDSHSKKELVLQNVDVYTTKDWVLKYKCDHVYLDLDNINYSIEVLPLKQPKNEKVK